MKNSQEMHFHVYAAWLELRLVCRAVAMKLMRDDGTLFRL
jgi:hypothetical protein